MCGYGGGVVHEGNSQCRGPEVSVSEGEMRAERCRGQVVWVGHGEDLAFPR